MASYHEWLAIVPYDRRHLTGHVAIKFAYGLCHRCDLCHHHVYDAIMCTALCVHTTALSLSNTLAIIHHGLQVPLQVRSIEAKKFLLEVAALAFCDMTSQVASSDFDSYFFYIWHSARHRRARRGR